MFERFTDRARRVLVAAQEQARELGHAFIGTEHVLLGLLAEEEGVAAKALASLGFDPAQAHARVRDLVRPGAAVAAGKPPFTPKAKKLLELSLREALSLGHNYIGTEHLLLALVALDDGVAAELLAAQGVSPHDVRISVAALMEGEDAASAVRNTIQRIRAIERSRFGEGEPSYVRRLSPAVRSALEVTSRFIDEVQPATARPQVITSGQLVIHWLSDEASHVARAAAAAGVDRDALVAAIIETPTAGTSDEPPEARRFTVELPDGETAARARALTPEQVAEAIRRYVGEPPQGDGDA